MKPPRYALRQKLKQLRIDMQYLREQRLTNILHNKVDDTLESRIWQLDIKYRLLVRGIEYP